MVMGMCTRAQHLPHMDVLAFNSPDVLLANRHIVWGDPAVIGPIDRCLCL